MSLRVLIAPDKFKGSLTAVDVAASIAKGWRHSRPGDRIESLAISDGGDGFGPVLAGLLGARAHSVVTVDAAHRPCTASWWWASTGQRALVEAAQANGLAQLPKGQYHPFDLDTYGLGGVLKACAQSRPKICLVGIGGSATNDGGFGMARALGWEFFDDTGGFILSWRHLLGLRRIQAPFKKLALGDVVVAVDVQNRLLGGTGCTRCYGPQKGLHPSDFESAEAALNQLANVVQDQLGVAPGNDPGSGAAGGLGFGLAVFASAQLTSGFDLFALHSQLRQRIASADLVITGEGRVDATTLMGKGAGGVAKICRELGKPCFALGGGTDGDAGLRLLFDRVWTLVPEHASLEEALALPSQLLERLSASIASAFPSDAGWLA